jgi:hypothetical protein
MAKNRPRQNMSLGPNNGGFGSGSSNANTPASGGNGNGGNGNGGNGNGRNNNNNNNNNNPFAAPATDTASGAGAPVLASSFDDWLRMQGINNNNLNPDRRQRLRAQYEATQGVDGAPPPNPDASLGGEGKGSIFDDPLASQSSGGDNTYKSTAWGLLNQAGIDNDPVFGQQQTAWLNDHIDQLWQRWKGEAQLTGEDRPDFDNWLLNQFGGAPPGTTPDRAFVTNQWGPAFQQYAGRMYQSLSPRARGTDMRQWQAPRRVIQF